MNFWKRSLFGAGVGVGAGSGPGAGALMADPLQQTGNIVERQEVERRVERRAERRAETSKKRADLPCLPNRLAEPLWELLEW